MAFPIEDNEKQAKVLEEKSIVVERPKDVVKKIPQILKEKVEATGNFFVIWTAVALYYFFSGIALVVHGKLPRQWKHFNKEQLNMVLTNVGEFTEKRKVEKQFGRVVDLDYSAPHVDLTKQ